MSFLTYPLNYTDYDYEDAETWLATRNSGVFVKNDFAYSVSGIDTNITFGEGLAWIHNHKFAGKVFKNDSDFVVDFGVNDTNYDRIDVAAIQFDKVANTARIIAKHGEAKTNPVIPPISQTEELYELYICSVRRKAGSVYITEGDVTDLRLSEYCGLMADNVTSIDTAAIYAQVMDLIRKLEAKIAGVESSAGIMLKSVYDTDNDGTVDNAEKLNGQPASYYATKTEVQTAQSTANGKAPTNHASTATTYGAGTASNYGHVKLSDSTSSTSGTGGGVAATPAAVKSAYDRATTGINNAANALSVANGKVSIKQIYLNTNYAVAFAEQDLMVGDYPMYIVEYRAYASSPTSEHTTDIVIDRTKIITGADGNSKIRSRSVDKISGGLHFYPGYDVGTVNNEVLVPFKIWGVSF